MVIRLIDSLHLLFANSATEQLFRPQPQVLPQSPAYCGGLLPGDIVLGVDNSPITGRPLTYSLAVSLISRATASIELQVLREPFNRVKKRIMYKSSPEPYSRPGSGLSTTGRIPAVAMMDSGVKIPENNIIEFHNEKAREQWAITKQTYRSTPLIEAKPKVRRDWPTGCYLRHMEGPGWHTLPKTVTVPEPAKMKVLSQYTQLPSGSSPEPNNNLVHLQYNSPINLYSSENVQNTLNPNRGPSPYSAASHSGSPQPPHFNAKVGGVSQNSHLQPPLQVDISQSPTYQFLQEEQDNRRHSPKYSPVTGHHSPGGQPVTQRGFKNLMHSLNVSEY